MRPGIGLDQLVDVLDLPANEMLQLCDHPHEQAPPIIAAQQGMFSFLGVTTPQVHALREKHHVYMTDDSRINIAGLRADNLEYFAKAVAQVLRPGSAQ